MADSGKHLKDRDLVLLVADAAGGTLNGRTVAQKLAYFSGIALHQPTGHTPYFYGPFSDDVERALSLAAVAGDLQETIERIPDWYGGSDAVKHIYKLTDSGAANIQKLKEERPAEADTVRQTVEAIRKAMPELRQKTLSAAAKINWILSEQKSSVQVSELPRLTKQLGWDLSRDEIEKTIEVLRQLGLVETQSA